MNAKSNTKTVDEVCPVPPWEPKHLLKLVRYLAVSQAELARLIGISYSTLRAWIGGRTQAPSVRTSDNLRKFEKQIPQLRKAALAKLAARQEKESRRASRLGKPWPVNRIRSFMHTWGMTQSEFAIFCNVSYDSVTSWSRGRRRLVRKQTAAHIEAAEQAARKRGFPVVGPNVKKHPWSGLKAFSFKNRLMHRLGEIPKSLVGTYSIRAAEAAPGRFLKGKPTDRLVIKKGPHRQTLEVKVTFNKTTLNLTGTWQKLGGLDYLALTAHADDPRFFQGRAGCLTPGQTLLRLSLWSPQKNLPLRFLAAGK